MKARLSAIRSAGTPASVASGPEPAVRLRAGSPVSLREVVPRVDVAPRVHPVRATAPGHPAPHLHVQVGTGRAARGPDPTEPSLLARDVLASRDGFGAE